MFPSSSYDSLDGFFLAELFNYCITSFAHWKKGKIGVHIWRIRIDLGFGFFSMMMITMSFCTFNIERDSPKKKSMGNMMTIPLNRYRVVVLVTFTLHWSTCRYHRHHMLDPFTSSRSDRRQSSATIPGVQGSTGANVMLALCLICTACTTPLCRGSRALPLDSKWTSYLSRGSGLAKSDQMKFHGSKYGVEILVLKRQEPWYL